MNKDQKLHELTMDFINYCVKWASSPQLLTRRTKLGHLPSHVHRCFDCYKENAGRLPNGSAVIEAAENMLGIMRNPELLDFLHRDDERLHVDHRQSNFRWTAIKSFNNAGHAATIRIATPGTARCLFLLDCKHRFDAWLNPTEPEHVF